MLKMAPVCGLCGKSEKLIRTKCCNNWICNDEDKYVLMSFAKNSCFRNHQRETVCGRHADVRHTGPWQSCGECKEIFETEMFVWMGTNEYNFQKLENPPKYEPTKCIGCDKVINLVEDEYSFEPFARFKGYECKSCNNKKRETSH